MSYRQLCFTIERNTAEEASDYLFQHDALSITAESADGEECFDVSTPGDPNWLSQRLTALFDENKLDQVFENSKLDRSQERRLQIGTKICLNLGEDGCHQSLVEVEAPLAPDNNIPVFDSEIEDPNQNLEEPIFIEQEANEAAEANEANYKASGYIPNEYSSSGNNHRFSLSLFNLHTELASRQTRNFGAGSSAGCSDDGSVTAWGTVMPGSDSRQRAAITRFEPRRSGSPSNLRAMPRGAERKKVRRQQAVNMYVPGAARGG